MHEKLMRMLRTLGGRVAWTEQDFNEQLVVGKRRPWAQRIAAGGASRCARCGRRPGECGCPPVR